MSRHRLPGRRQGWRINVQPDLGSRVIYAVTVGFDEAEPTIPREMFISCNKLTSASNIAGLEIAVLVSIALQHGATFAEMAAALPRENREGRPQGAAGAIMDAVIAQLAKEGV